MQFLFFSFLASRIAICATTKRKDAVSAILRSKAGTSNADFCFYYFAAFLILVCVNQVLTVVYISVNLREIYL